jgi:uncharacterized protein (DUF1778 family)
MGRAVVMTPNEGAEAPATITLTARDWEAFLAALENPPPPNKALKDLMREFGPWADQTPSQAGC